MRLSAVIVLLGASAVFATNSYGQELTKEEAAAIRQYPILAAIATDDTSALRRMIDSGANTSALTPLGTPVSFAVSGNFVKSLALLLESGADPEKVDTKGWPPIHCAITADGSKIACIRILLKKGANVDATDRHQKTALHRAAQFGDQAAVLLLLQHGANPLLKDENGFTPRDRANGNNPQGESHPDVAAILSNAERTSSPQQ
jgi:ankyrin repeat protein